MAPNRPGVVARPSDVAVYRAAPRQPAINRVLNAVLRSPLSGAVDAWLVLLTVRGWRTGREITLPVQYAVGDDAIWVWPGHPETKYWWRSLRAESPVRLRLLGAEVTATARVVTTSTEPALLAKGRRAYVARFPRTVSAPTLLVRIDVPSDALARARRATAVPGSGAVAVIRRHPLGAYFLFAYLISWSYWIPTAIAGGRVSHFPGLLGPMLAAFVVTAIVTGRTGLRDLARRMVRWRVPARWYAALLVPLAAALVALAALRLAGQGLPTLEQLSDMPGLPAVGWFGVLALAFLINGYGEETGWRGFAWPRLRERHTLGGAALILAVPWAAWHIPTFWLDTGMRGFAPFMIPGFLVGMAAGAVVLGWMYDHARSSLFLVAVWHAVLNMASATKGTEAVAAAASVAVIAWAVLVLRAEHRSRHADRSETVVNRPR